MLIILNVSLLLLIIQLHASFSHSKFVIVIIAITMNTQNYKSSKNKPNRKKVVRVFGIFHAEYPIEASVGWVLTQQNC